MLDESSLEIYLNSSNQVCLVKAMVFPVVMYGCESWTVRKAECRRIHAFELWCWRRLLRVTWTARRSNQSILKEINPGISLEGMMSAPDSEYLPESGCIFLLYHNAQKSDWSVSDGGTSKD